MSSPPESVVRANGVADSVNDREFGDTPCSPDDAMPPELGIVDLQELAVAHRALLDRLRRTNALDAGEARHLERATHFLRREVAQDHDNLEVIVVDDGSTDGSWDVISAYHWRSMPERLYAYRLHGSNSFSDLEHVRSSARSSCAAS